MNQRAHTTYSTTVMTITLLILSTPCFTLSKPFDCHPWSRSLSEQIYPEFPISAFDRLLAQGVSNNLYAFDVKTGYPLWNVTLPVRIFPSALTDPSHHDWDSIYLHSNTTMFSVSTATGHVKWSVGGFGEQGHPTYVPLMTPDGKYLMANRFSVQRQQNVLFYIDPATGNFLNDVLLMPLCDSVPSGNVLPVVITDVTYFACFWNSTSNVQVVAEQGLEDHNVPTTLFDFAPMSVMLFDRAPSLSSATYTGPIWGTLTKVAFLVSAVASHRDGGSLTEMVYNGPSTAVCAIAQMGRLEWRVDLSEYHKGPVTSFTRAGPNEDVAMKLVFSDSYTALVALDESRLGQKLWTYDIPKTLFNNTVTVGMASPITATNSHLVFSQATNTNQLQSLLTDIVTSLNVFTGAVRALAPITDHITTQPFAFNDVIYVPSDHEVNVINATTGEWMHWWMSNAPVRALHPGLFSHKKELPKVVIFGTNYTVFAFGVM